MVVADGPGGVCAVLVCTFARVGQGLKGPRARAVSARTSPLVVCVRQLRIAHRGGDAQLHARRALHLQEALGLQRAQRRGELLRVGSSKPAPRAQPSNWSEGTSTRVATSPPSAPPSAPPPPGRPPTSARASAAPNLGATKSQARACCVPTRRPFGSSPPSPSPSPSPPPKLETGMSYARACATVHAWDGGGEGMRQDYVDGSSGSGSGGGSSGSGGSGG
eukprot:7383619-Prymnesium_polylepis.2